ncbi:hypothetical protein C8_77 [Cannes 8 virus]|uniref:hypothetical protein n=1 Tax=Melbournevirus TaxID=1560514 RepID=UPI000392B3BB|nr:hypothetical protein MEL_064 [Melbournevirus]AGV01426.1 hypothetical protein C8_77 [Cannes 8 virus]AIT54677.1 hypothetical protein MEL_064 [Melbournevirus]WRK65475.1 hypothetical protein MarFTME_430 [Marseillevirus futianmevirus]
MNIDSTQYVTSGDESEFVVPIGETTWTTNQLYCIIDACFDLNKRATQSITNPLYHVSLSHGDSEFIRFRIPITKVYDGIQGYTTFFRPSRDVTTSASDTITVRIVDSSGTRIQNPGSWALSFFMSSSG